MEAAGEQQQRQYGVEEHTRQMRVVKRAAKPPHDVQMKHVIAGDDQQRNRERAQQHADRGRQPNPQVIDAADESRQRQNDG